MPFVKLEKRIGVKDDRGGASLSMRTYKGSPKPITTLALRCHFLETTKFANAKNFDVAVGDGSDAGKIAVTPNAKGAFVARQLKSGLILDLGHLPQMGMAEHKNHSALVELIDGSAIVTVPEWSPESDDDDDDEEDAEIDTAPAQSGAATLLSKSNGKSAVQSVTWHGVTINLTPDNEAVSYRGQTAEVSPRGALLIEALARVMPSCVGDDFLIGKLWKIKPAGAASALDMVMRDLSSLKKLGLELRTQRGVGRQLVDIKA